MCGYSESVQKMLWECTDLHYLPWKTHTQNFSIIYLMWKRIISGKKRIGLNWIIFSCTETLCWAVYQDMRFIFYRAQLYKIRGIKVHRNTFLWSSEKARRCPDKKRVHERMCQNVDFTLWWVHEPFFLEERYFPN